MTKLRFASSIACAAVSDVATARARGGERRGRDRVVERMKVVRTGARCFFELELVLLAVDLGDDAIRIGVRCGVAQQRVREAGARHPFDRRVETSGVLGMIENGVVPGEERMGVDLQHLREEGAAAMMRAV